MPIYSLGDLEPSIDSTAYIHPEAVIIGNVTIGSESSVWACAVLRGDDGEITIGNRSNIQDGAVIHTTPIFPTVVGNNCTIGHLAHLEGCTIEDGALIGTASVVLHDAKVQEGALVGANAVVTGGTVVPPGAMALGIPAKVGKGLANQEEISLGVESYVARAKWFREDLRRID
ncbi:MAG: gamma carbonic anhydrase family protein [Acidimicrobiales bacterium]|jgi:carbonic anhydrase/acetyltransferase-like protein (isoleucine patch superfamily)|nr:gamma carbonic anhydrase family protein [Acidimicrobiales bacterium]MDP6298753.1 gamma carbonic anhydrase family protein [Acidimicrobiales bacterium]HJM29322.1 gamma carbonic anhydrase family protein [Acidimicrobiales bacterium]HJM98288.1 gamma carbonic anhydrase family protein [Acidimicrobiales bacterium]